MPFKKLHSNIQEKLEYLDIVTPTPFQSSSIPVIKSVLMSIAQLQKIAEKRLRLYLLLCKS